MFLLCVCISVGPGNQSNTMFKFVLYLGRFSILYKSSTVNSEIFSGILFLQIALQDLFSTLKIRDYGMIYLYQ